MLAREGVGLRLYQRLYPWRESLRLLDPEEVYKRLSKEKVVCLEAELEGGG